MIKRIATSLAVIIFAGVYVFAVVEKQDKPSEAFINGLREKQNITNNMKKLDISRIDIKENEKLGRIVDSSKGYDKKYREFTNKILEAGTAQNELFRVVGNAYVSGFNMESAGNKFISDNTMKKNEKINLSKIDDNGFKTLGKNISKTWSAEKYKAISQKSETEIDIFTIIGYSYIAGYNLMIDSMIDKNIKHGNTGEVDSMGM